MSEIKNCKITTGYEYNSKGYADDSDQNKYYVELEIPIPGGRAVYKLYTTKDINTSIETAEKLKK